MQRTLTFTDLRDGLRQCGDMLLLGPPGAGKTTALWRLALDLAEDGLYRSAGAQLPVFVRLGSLQEGQELLDRLQDDLATAAIYDVQGRARPLLAHQMLASLLPFLLKQGRLVLLWDGLNETPQRLFVATARRLSELRQQYAAPPGQVCTQHLITCRVDDYERLVADCDAKTPLPLTQTTLQGLDQETIQQIVLARLGPERGADLLDALEMPTQRTLAGLARTPLLLTMLCVVYDVHGVLPDTRGKLLEQFVQARMAWERQSTPCAWVEANVQTKVLAHLAYAMTESQGRGTSADWAWVHQRLVEVAPELCPEQLLAQARASDLLELVDQDTQVRFTHQLIQEYFAALALRDKLLVVDQRRKHWLMSWLGQRQLARYWSLNQRTGWEETLLLLAGLEGQGSIASALVRAFVDRLSQPLEAAKLLRASGRLGNPVLVEEVRNAALMQIINPSQPRTVRLAAGEALGLVGDPRLLDPRIGDSSTGDYWCLIEAGPFWFGDERNERLQQIEQSYSFKIARIPVTNAEYRYFIEADGYNPGKFWWSIEGRKWLLPGGHPASWENNYQTINKPWLCNDNRFNKSSQPVSGVSWYEAVAFCSWMTNQGHIYGWLPKSDIIRLPTLREWQRAARHTDKRRYPWGNTAHNPEYANYKETNIKKPSPVGSFPSGQAVCGALDLAGNLWEWTATVWRSPQQSEPVSDIVQQDMPIIVGGSFHMGNENLRCGNRSWSLPLNGIGDLSIRLVWAPCSLP